MTRDLVMLSASYAFVVFVLLLILIRSRLAVWLRVIAVLLAAGIYVLHFYSLENLRGWPTAAELPESFMLKAWQITEPNRAAQQSGRIDIWIQADDWEAPRAYELAYSKILHEQLEAAGTRMAEGYRQRGVAKGSGEVNVSDATRRLPLKTAPAQ